MIDFQTIILFTVLFLCQCYIGFTVYRVTDSELAVLTAFLLPLGIGLYIVQVLVLERRFPRWQINKEVRYWLQWSYIFIIIQYIAAIIIYMDFISF